MPSKSKTRSFPKDKNLLLKPTESHHALVKKCKPQDVLFDSFTLPILRLRISIPEAPGSTIAGSEIKLLTRMKNTDYFMINTMFEAAFPWSTESEKQMEKTYIEKNYSTVVDSKVKGVWVTSDVALEIAKDYDMVPYVEALIAASPGQPADTLIGTGKLSETGGAMEVPKLEEPRRSRRSVSPKKSVPAKVPKAPGSTGGRGRRKKGSIKDDESVASTTGSPVIPEATIPEEIVIKAEEAIDKVVEESKPFLDTIKVGVNDSAELLAAAKAQVEAAQAEEESEPSATRVKRTLEIDEQDSNEEIPVKRTKVDDLEKQIWYDDRRGRALLGLAIGLGVSVVLPYMI